MRKEKRFGGLILALVMVFIMIPATVVTTWANVIDRGACGDHLTWTLDGDGLLTISGTGDPWSYPYPEGESGFSQHWEDLLNVVIEPGMTSIADSMFEGLHLEHITVPDTVTAIGKRAFADCTELREFVIPEGVTVIQEWTFSMCHSLETVVIPSTLTSIEDRAFNGCRALTGLTLPEGLVSIGEESLAGCLSFESLTIPSTVTSIGNRAFASSFINSPEDQHVISFLGSAPSIGERAFEFVSATVYYPANAPTWTEAVRQDYGGSLTWKNLVSITPGEKTLGVGQTFQFSATVMPVGADQTVTWRVGNPAIATVDSSGKVTAKAAGSTWLYARTKNGWEEKCLLKVVVPTAVTLPCSEKSLGIGESFVFKATVTPADAEQTVTWRVGNTSIATVNSAGKVTAKAAGNTWLYARTKNGLEAKCLLKVVVPTAVSLPWREKTMNVGDSLTFAATVSPSQGTHAVTWRVGNTSIATVDANGKVTAKTAGNTWLYARTVNGLEAKCLLRVIAPTAVSLPCSEMTLNVGSNFTFKATVSPSQAAQTVTWRVGNPLIATVDANGTVTAWVAGNTWLYARTGNGLEAKCLLRVVKPTAVSLPCSEKALTVGESFTFTATVSPSQAAQTVTWRVGNTAIATVDANGKVTAKTVGNTWLYAKTSNGKEAKCLLKVTASELSIGASEKALTVGQTYQFTATGAGGTVTWRVGNPAIATVDASGKVTAKAVGNTYVYAKDGSGKEVRCLLRISAG